MTTSTHHRRERPLMGAPSLWRAPRRAAHIIREFNAEQVHHWERYYLASRALVPGDGPLAWVPTLDGYRLTGSHLPAPADEATHRTF